MTQEKVMPWEAHPEIWSTRAKFFTFLRGKLRSAWVNHPVKIEAMKRAEVQIVNDNPRSMKAHPTIKGYKCAQCGHTDRVKTGKKSNFHADHIIPAGSFNEINDIQGFVERLLVINADDIRCLCTLCNMTYAHADKYDLTFEQAAADKQAIAIQNDKKDNEWLIERGITPDKLKKNRRQQIYEQLLKET